MPKTEKPWIFVATRRIAAAAIPGVSPVEIVMAELCETYKREDWELFNTHFIGIEPGGIADAMFVFIRRVPPDVKLPKSK